MYSDNNQLYLQF